MAVFHKIRELIAPSLSVSEVIIPAQPTTYSIHPLTERQIDEVLRLNKRCFATGENYELKTLEYLLNAPDVLSYRVVSADEKMVGFCIVGIKDGTGHLASIGVAPEYRQRGIARLLLNHLENALRKREINMICLEVRISNNAAQNLYLKNSYSVMQRLSNYYNNGEDGYLMVKSLI